MSGGEIQALDYTSELTLVMGSLWAEFSWRGTKAKKKSRAGFLLLGCLREVLAVWAFSSFFYFCFLFSDVVVG